MAELIPLDYRIGVAQRRQIRSWAAGASLALALAAGGLFWAYSWQHEREKEYDIVADQVRRKSAILAEAKEFRASRSRLAQQMKTMQELRDDRILLTMLTDSTAQFSDGDRLESIQIAAHPNGASPGKSGGAYSVKMRGITTNDESFAKLFDRLTRTGGKSAIPLRVEPGKTNTENFLDGRVTRFEIVCQESQE